MRSAAALLWSFANISRPLAIGQVARTSRITDEGCAVVELAHICEE
jgi:hypothetical protein